MSSLDIRSVTCRCGGALWASLGHAGEVAPGATLELLTADPLAWSDMPEWAGREGWDVAIRDEDGFGRFEMGRPRRTPRR